jgi:hypothetical protein
VVAEAVVSDEAIADVPERDEALGSLRGKAEAAGLAWARASAEAVQREGRVVAGGWPGTVSEAKALAGECARRARVRALGPRELRELTRLVYAAARRNWLATAIRCSD